jgi:hypothetical protein
MYNRKHLQSCLERFSPSHNLIIKPVIYHGFGDTF